MLDPQGACPICHKNDGHLHGGYLGREHWYRCDTCLTKWCIGENLFSSWHHLTDQERVEQADQLKEYCEVEPVLLPFPSAPP